MPSLRKMADGTQTLLPFASVEEEAGGSKPAAPGPMTRREELEHQRKMALINGGFELAQLLVAAAVEDQTLQARLTRDACTV